MGLNLPPGMINETKRRNIRLRDAAIEKVAARFSKVNTIAKVESCLKNKTNLSLVLINTPVKRVTK